MFSVPTRTQLLLCSRDDYSLQLEDTVVSLSPASVVDPKQRIVIVYRNALVRDLLTRVLIDGGLSVVGAIQESQLDGSTFQDLDPDVVVFDEAEADAVRTAAQAVVFSPTTPGLKKVIVVGLGYLMIVAYRKEILRDASIEDLVVGAGHTMDYGR